ncbi:DUF4386 domain-containing protein [Flavobacterium sp. ZT3R18]|uniref:DUF4386 domain-containing protein n=1 Tax=Flavobacterium sp. ZT3R18 TaxID=2594429 RepID=UPI001179E884|nr:DUF4386 domain-containing protein [Flavobacterium sp. ZT3R18]TRX35838.1 DUF4386 domain-containing protein [Flavobacterium sp. ZT3R18]
MKSNNIQIEIKNAKIIGAFFLLVFLAYGFGRYYFKSDAIFIKYIGSTLILLNSTMVLFIGILFRKTLRQYNSTVGNVYLFTRIFEAIALAIVVLKLFFKVNISDDFGYFPAMLVLGLGSIPMCLTLYKYQISPSWLALWGVIGYTIFAFGFLMELFAKEWSMYLIIFAGLWEITFGLWLITRKSKNLRDKTTTR